MSRASSYHKLEPRPLTYSVPLPSPLLLHFSAGFDICSIKVSSDSDNSTGADTTRLAVHTATTKTADTMHRVFGHVGGAETGIQLLSCVEQ